MKARYGPWALIAGGSEGVGAAIARRLAAAGIHLLLVARRETPLLELARDIAARSGVEVRTLALDLSAPDMAERIEAASAGLEIGLLVFNAGAAFGGGRFLDNQLDDLLRTIRGNAVAQVSLVHRFGRGMAARGRGGIAITGSLAGNAGSATMALYGAGKAFAQNLAEALWAELSPLGIDVAYAVLGATDTPARARSGVVDPPGVVAADADDVARQILERLPYGPVIVPDGMGDGFAFFATADRRAAADAMRAMMTGFMPETG